MIVVTGLMRSGTSAIAKMLHQAGVQMGRTQMIPDAGGMHEWEDLELQSPTASWVMGTERTPERHLRVEAFKEYIVTRRDDYKNTERLMRPGNLRGFGVKTPFLAPYLADFERAARAAKEPLTIITTKRRLSDTLKSAEKRTSLYEPEYARMLFAAIEEAQGLIADSLHGRNDMSIPIQDIWLNAGTVAALVAHECDLGDVNIDAMAKGIGKEYA